MSSKSSFRLLLTDFVRPLLALFALTAVACAGTVTPPDSTPVYADDIGQGVLPVDVEHQSTNRPEPEMVRAEREKSDAAPPQEDEKNASPDAPDAEKPPAEAPSVTSPSPEPAP